MMNRIFDPEEPIDLPFQAESAEGHPPETTQAPADRTTAPESPASRLAGPAAAPAQQATAGATASNADPAATATRRTASHSRTRPQGTGQRSGARARRRPNERILLISALAGVCMVSVAGSLITFGSWNRLQQSLNQERNLLLVERLRSLGPATPTPIQAPESPAATQTYGADTASGSAGLPPPPPEEPWIQQLSTLPAPAPASSQVLRVPLSPRLNAPAPATSDSRPSAAATRSSAPLPQLVGVVGGQGRPPSAIFLISGNSMNVGPGESIGGSGWRLRSADGETALIERDGDLRQVSIASGNGF